VEAPRAAWRTLAARNRADLRIIECVCVDQTTHRRRIEARIRGIEGMAEVTWTGVEKRRAEYEAWTDPRLTLDTSAHPTERLLAEAIEYLT
jgi:predicted kinase